ncbi:hypothetical protein [Streptomyces antibioticus]|uniref:hypothetical protein n=1 Tax=Streptomyces antibioticus TaxID=1890 RepID=UPI0037B70C1A
MSLLPPSLPPSHPVPPPCEVPLFAPVRVRGGRYGLGRLVRNRRRALAAGLAVTAVALVAAAGPHGGGPARGHPGPGSESGPAPGAGSGEGPPAHARSSPKGAKVTAPVRIADAATVRLLRPGDRVDVIAAERTASGDTAEVVARGALVTKIPEPLESSAAGALIVLSVPRPTAVRLAGAGTTARLAVTLW